MSSPLLPPSSNSARLGRSKPTVKRRGRRQAPSSEVVDHIDESGHDCIAETHLPAAEANLADSVDIESHAIDCNDPVPIAVATVCSIENYSELKTAETNEVHSILTEANMEKASYGTREADSALPASCTADTMDAAGAVSVPNISDVEPTPVPITNTDSSKYSDNTNNMSYPADTPPECSEFDVDLYRSGPPPRNYFPVQSDSFLEKVTPPPSRLSVPEPVPSTRIERLSQDELSLYASSKKTPYGSHSMSIDGGKRSRKAVIRQRGFYEDDDSDGHIPCAGICSERVSWAFMWLGACADYFSWCPSIGDI